MRTLPQKSSFEKKNSGVIKKRSEKKKSARARGQAAKKSRKKNSKNKRMSMAPNFKFGGKSKAKNVDPRISLEFGINFGKGDHVLVIKDRPSDSTGNFALEKNLLSKNTSKHSMTLGSGKRSKAKNSKKRKKEKRTFELEEEIKETDSSNLKDSRVKTERGSDVALPILQKSLRRMKKIGSKKPKPAYKTNEIQRESFSKSNFVNLNNSQKAKNKKTFSNAFLLDSNPDFRPRQVSGPGKMLQNPVFDPNDFDYGPSSVQVVNNNYDSWQDGGQAFKFLKKSEVSFDKSNFYQEQFDSHKISIENRQMGSSFPNSKDRGYETETPFQGKNTNLTTGYDSFGNGGKGRLNNDIKEDEYKMPAEAMKKVGKSNMITHSFGNISSQKDIGREEMMQLIFQNYDQWEDELQTMIRNKTLTDLSVKNSQMKSHRDQSFERTPANLVISVENDVIDSSSKIVFFVF